MACCEEQGSEPRPDRPACAGEKDAVGHLRAPELRAAFAPVSGDRQLSPFPEHLSAPFGVGRLGEEVALHLVAAVGAQKSELVLGLDAFGYDPEPEVLGEVDDGPGERRAVGVRGYVVDEAAVDLQGVDG
jgi:hypothetical protein